MAASPALLQESDESWGRVLDINLTGLFYSCREEAKAMIKLPKAPRAIVNVSSMAPFLHQGMMHAYGASKSGVHYFSEILAVDLRTYGIRVNSVCPGKCINVFLIRLSRQEPAMLTRSYCHVLGLTETPMKGEFMGGNLDAPPPVPVIQPEDVADVAAWLLSNDAPLLSGAHLPIGVGMP